jgi:hypothetical protein
MKDAMELFGDLQEDWVNICEDNIQQSGRGSRQLASNMKKFSPMNYPTYYRVLELVTELQKKLVEFKPHIAKAEQADQAESDLLLQDRNQDYEDSVL